MALTAAERMKAMRERRKQESGLKYTEVYIPETHLMIARERAESERNTLRAVLTDAIVMGLESGTSHVTPERAGQVFVEALDKAELGAVDEWRATNGSGSLFADLVNLVMAGIEARNTLQAASKKKGRPSLRSREVAEGRAKGQGRRSADGATAAERTLDASPTEGTIRRRRKGKEGDGKD